MDIKVKYWIDLSDYDLETAEAMLLSKRYLYVGFMCHQTIEKAFKAYYTDLNLKQLPLNTVCPIWPEKGIFMSHLLMSRKIFQTSWNH